MLRTILMACVVLVMGVSAAYAHKGRPMFVEVSALDEMNYRLSWKFPPALKKSDLPLVSLTPECRNAAGEGRAAQSGQQNVGTALLVCDKPIEDLKLAVRYPDFNPGIPTLLRVMQLDGGTYSTFGSPETSELSLVEGGGDGALSGGIAAYFKQGMIHIGEGIDHLLFVACLVFIAGSLRRILITVTGFTLAHSLTLGLSALDLFSLPIAPVEASIALSILFLAYELVRPSRETLTWRYPMLVSSGFGLLHGFGFASALSEIGLPQTEKLWALAMFNVGVEAGQVLFVLMLVPLVYVLSETRFSNAQRVQTFAAYIIGSIAMLWTFERVFF